jgi:hypothetical protein
LLQIFGSAFEGFPDGRYEALRPHRLYGRLNVIRDGVDCSGECFIYALQHQN